ncbi:MAG: HPr family phosphocarrier protein [Eubacteriales bacterium]|nr:HPr family phosphocarrier protein [Eubacteriales bacterium]
MVKQRVTVKNPSGLHLRPADILCREAVKYKSLISFDFQGGTANAKSVLSVLGACVKCGDEIQIVCEGADEKEALQSIINIIQSGLGE